MKSDFLAAPILRNLTAEWEPRSFTLTRRGTRQIVSIVGPEPAEYFVQHLWVKAFYLKGIPVRRLVITALALSVLFVGAQQRDFFEGSPEWQGYSTEWKTKVGEIRRALTDSSARFQQDLNRVGRSMLASLEPELRTWRVKTEEASRQARERFADAANDWRVWTVALQQRLKEAKPDWQTLRAHFTRDIEELKPVAKQEAERKSS